nr:GNAT family N-acetyltransferase [Oceanococcus sp. HetDA_MAG_MS8]
MRTQTPLQHPGAAFVDVFKQAFTHSEGAQEGALIAALVQELLSGSKADIHCCAGYVDDEVVAAVVFSRMAFSEDSRSVFLLSPMAVLPQKQGQGFGQALINAGLSMLRDAGVDVVLTYGDPAYYQRVGFAAISAEQAQPPHRLQQPHGWLGQSLDGVLPWPPLRGTSQCAAALDHPDYW